MWERRPITAILIAQLEPLRFGVIGVNRLQASTGVPPRQRELFKTLLPATTE
jgi:hypothetical protein